MKWINRLGKGVAAFAVLGITGAGGAGCLARPVGKQPPTTKVNFTSTVSQQAVDKVDLLFMIDNSASMGDKQEILADAVPQLIQGLIRPRCVGPDEKPLTDAQGGVLRADPLADEASKYGCQAAGGEPEFKPVTDMHIGVISSSLGSFGGDVCTDTGRLNDKGRLLALVKGGGEVAEAKPSNFLSWFPDVPENKDEKRHPKPPTQAIGQINTLAPLFQKVVTGVEQSGCGLEAQLESIYRFLVQPDPWDKITVDKNNQADLGKEVDVTVLKQRADFLRPDSLVAIIALTDEEDSSADPLSAGGQGWAFMSNQFPGSSVFRPDGKSTTAPRATSTCKTNPASPDCTSCGFAATCDATQPACKKIKDDPECQKNGGYYGPTEDQLNVRFHRMKERYGIDPQYPIRRYVDGFTKFKVPDRTTEHKITVAGARRTIQPYGTDVKCTNPLFASKLPREPGDELCNLPRSTRSPDLVFFAVVGGVPWQLLPKVGSDERPDWNKILGRDPLNFNFDGIDPHMIESVSPRAGLPGPSPTAGDNGPVPTPANVFHGREWDTNGDDLQYACTFELPKDKQRTCTSSDPSCDCAGTKNPPLCGQAKGSQIKAKAYPTLREFQVVRALGDNGVIASLCPIQLTGADKTAADYGYNPAVIAIVNRLKNALTAQCLPQKLQRDATTQEVPCLVLATLAEATDSCEAQGLKKPDPEIERIFREQQKAESGDTSAAGATDLTRLPVCVMPQSKVAAGESCKDSQDASWCYVENTGTQFPATPECTAQGRPQALLLSAGSRKLQGARFNLQCINNLLEGQAAGDQAAANP